MSAVEFKPEWRIGHAQACRCTLCGRQVEDEEVWRWWDTPASYRFNVCQECASAVGPQQLRA